MIKPKFFGTAKNGHLALDHSDLFREHMRQYDEGTELEMTVAKRSHRRTQGAPGESTNFNGYYWAVIVRMISDAVGEVNDDDTHYLLQMLFNKRGLTVYDAKIKAERNIEIPAGTSEMSGGEFSEYCSKIRTWAGIPKDQGGLGLYIPEPNEGDYDR